MSETNDVIETGKKRVRRDRTEEILVEATKLFSEYGFKGTTLSMVAEAVGLSEPGVLHYFPSKTHLLHGVLEYREEKGLEKYSNLVDIEKLDVSELFSLLDDLVAGNEKIPGMIRLFTVLVGESIRPDHPSHDFFVDRYRRSREMYNGVFAQSSLKLRPDVDPEELATLIMAVMDGLQIQWLLDPESVDMAKTFELFVKILVGYLEE